VKKIFSILTKLLLLGIIISIPYFIYRYFFTPQKIGINEVTSGGGYLDPQYIFVRKDVMGCNPSDCSQLWNFENNTNFQTGVDDILSKIGTFGTTNRKLGIGIQINYNLFNKTNLENNLNKILAISKAQNIPLYIALEGSQWLGMPSVGFPGKTAIWNWWDTSLNADIANKSNVERTGWNLDTAPTKAWRNWGGEMEILPPANLGSQELLDNNKDEVKHYAGIISRWYNTELLDSQKWLLGGISTGTETDVGFSSYIKKNPSVPGDARDSFQIGYAALVSKNMRSAGGPPTKEELNKIVVDYLDALNSEIIKLDIPRDKIFNHTFGTNLNDPRVVLTNTYQDTFSAVSNNANPGWSLYRPFSENLGMIVNNLSATLNSVSNNEWSSSEFWITNQNYDNEDTPDQRLDKDVKHENLWFNSMNNILNFRNMRYINIANWENTRNAPTILKAIRRTLNTSPSCWVTRPNLTINTTGTTTNLAWSGGTNNNIVSLQVSDAQEYTVSGLLKNPNVFSQNNLNSSSQSLPNLVAGKKYYLALIVDGCTNQRRFIYKTINPTSTVFNPSDYNGKPVKGTSDTTSVYFMEAGKRRGIPDWDTYVHSLGFKVGDEIVLPDTSINSIPLGTPVPPVPAHIFNGKPVKGTTDKDTIYLVENGIRRSYPTEALFLASFTHAQVIQLSDATLARIPSGKDVGDNSPSTKPGDLNGDDKVNLYDYTELISGYGTQYTDDDFINVLANYGK
jgi:hypothetical protein